MRKLPDIEELLDLWLVKYHNTTMQKVREEHAEWMENPQEHTREFYEKYAVTQEQENEWVKEAKELLNKKYKISKKIIDRGWWSIVLNCSPYVSKEN